ncbi:MAG TPA: hypothetical protein PKC73_01785 [Dermatophilaceae bacterium]|jgi:hypothetical protein|nr:hypothetical protein [Actinomycetales bacterium]HMT32461.1 hypothetical protein [Dermatophilaceae bacterium]HMT88343.1 hypothetical protein [Dermatophilaceae bacterium]
MSYLTKTSTTLRASSLALLGTLLVVAGPLADVVNKFHISYTLAKYIVQLVVTGAGWLLGTVFPAAIPFIAIIKLLFSLYGSSYVINW